MVERAIQINLMLRQIHIYWEVSLVILALYFLVKCFTRIDARWAVCLAITISMMAQIVYDWPKALQDIMQCIIMAIIQCGFSIGLYSMADKYGWPEKISGVVTRSLDRKGGPA